ncbi:thioredoxin reductase [Thermosporothrix hazakensis]|jgi:thioredoxin reductase/SAM-dependent methyltransferase|uniref:Thioredoxin reductase n=1 Tax=Thermosporothrix hazakensis TaxID=644383 RepID=A0A326TRW9_THEHA|nr:FAD-dependent oxidoreductase [Thermosporothrix hazakensis]PZW19498.1 thioredoxin reductase [Thermosporothrix hazakensis]GCE51422.1 methyltransferase [Thermosporothrix hazakensis]
MVQETFGSAQGPIDVVVIGGGVAGLSGALALVRARRSVVVVDSGQPRNAFAAHVHNYLSRDGIPPSDLLAAGRAEVAGYGGKLIAGKVSSVERLNSQGEHTGFRVKLANGSSIDTRRILVTTGLVDELPDIPGVAERWGRDVLHCPYCHGWEVRDQAIGILGTGPMAVHGALLFRQWSADVILFQHTAPALSQEQAEQLEARGITVVEGEVSALEVRDDQLVGVRLRSGEVIPRQALVVSPRFAARAEVLRSLGLKTADLEVAGSVVGSYVPADANGATAVAGVWVAGNVSDPLATVVAAASAGLKAGAAINADLITEDTAHDVAAFRARGGVRKCQERNGPHHEDGRDQTEQFWEEFYRKQEQVWSGRANPVLVDIVESLPPGTALDLGCGEGGDAIWLARRGWRVTAVDVSLTALKRASDYAATVGVEDRIDFQQHDLAHSFPAGTFDLVSAQYFHAPIAFPRDRILQAAARAVAPGGLLLIVDHASFPFWSSHHNSHMHFSTPEEVLAELKLSPESWRTERLETRQRQVLSPKRQSGTVADNIIAVRRLPKRGDLHE